MAAGDEFKQTMQGWLNQMAAQQSTTNRPTSQTNLVQTQSQSGSPFQSLGTTDMKKGTMPDNTNSLGVRLALDSQNTLGTRLHAFSVNEKSIKLTEIQTKNDSGTKHE